MTASSAVEAIKEAVYGQFTATHCIPDGSNEHTYTFPADAGTGQSAAYDIDVMVDSQTGSASGGIELETSYDDPYVDPAYYDWADVGWGVSLEAGVNVSISAPDTIIEGYEEQATVTVTNSQGVPLAGVPLRLTVEDGSILAASWSAGGAQTDPNGQAIVDLAGLAGGVTKLAVETMTAGGSRNGKIDSRIKVVHPGVKILDDQNGGTAGGKTTVQKNAVTVITIQLLDEDGKPLAKAGVNVKLDMGNMAGANLILRDEVTDNAGQIKIDVLANDVNGAGETYSLQVLDKDDNQIGTLVTGTIMVKP